MVLKINNNWTEIIGLPGVGKTRYLYENRDKYQGGNIVHAAYKILYQSERPIEVIKGLLN